ncbi:MAG: penicillin-binding protein 2, partial [Pseudomonadota bacterium]
RQRQAVFDLGLEGLGFRAESHRAYPRGAQAGHVLGHTDIDGVGRMGVERAMDGVLAEGGEALRLTLDSGVQFALESELSQAAMRHDAVGAAGIVIDVASGEVRAMASWPAFDPNRPAMASDAERLNRASGAVYELGSVFKPLTVASALEAGMVHPADTFDLRAPLVVEGKAITDTHALSAIASVTEILAESSNIGTVQIAQKTGPRRLQSFFASLGLTTRAPIEIAPSAAPIAPQIWGDLSTATISYGHGIAVTPLAFAHAMTALANGGEQPVLSLIAETEKADPARVMSAPTARVVTQMLRSAVLEGTGLRADVAGYRVAGKTGTAEKPVPGGYAADRNITSFAALFPAHSPEYVVLIVLDDARALEGEGATAAWTAAPAAGRVIERIAPLLGVAPRLEDVEDIPRASLDRRAL